MSINITMLAPGFVGNTFYNTGATADVADADAVAAISSRIARYTTAPLLSQVASTEALLSSFEGLSSSKKEEFRDALGITGGGGGDSSSIVVEQAQTAHGLTVGKPVTRDASGNFILAVANDTQVKAAAVGVVSAVPDANNLTVTLYGPIDSGLSGLTAPGLYYVANDGSLTLDTSNATNWVVPILFATSSTSGYVMPQTPLSKARIPISAIEGKSLSKSANYTVGTGSADEAYGYIIYVTAACTITLPAIAVGMSVTVIVDAAAAVSVKANAADKIRLDGTALDDGDKITSGGAKGDIAVLTYYSADGWFASTNGWTDGGA